MKQSIDINCDLGEIDDSPNLEHDAQFLDYVSSINIACGYHAGDDRRMRQLCQLAAQKQVRIGAHPGYADRENFGRIPMELGDQELRQIMRDQIQRLIVYASEAGTSVAYVKPHGALYNLAARDLRTATILAESIASLDSSLALMGLSGSAMLVAASQRGLPSISEAFIDRNLGSDGLLVDRRRDDAIIRDESQAIDRALGLIKEGHVRSVEGQRIALDAQSLCIHGDTPKALSMAKRLWDVLKLEGIKVIARR